jgi:hypothetical protein
VTTLHSRSGNCVAALQPAPGDLFVVVLIAGRLALVRAAQDYEQVLRLAHAFAEGAQPRDGRPVTIKVLGTSLAEFLLLSRMDRAAFEAGMGDDEAEFRKLAEQTCRDVLLNSMDPAARSDAYDLLAGMGAGVLS